MDAAQARLFVIVASTVALAALAAAEMVREVRRIRAEGMADGFVAGRMSSILAVTVSDVSPATAGPVATSAPGA